MKYIFKVWIQFPSYIATLVGAIGIALIGDQYILDVPFKIESQFTPIFLLSFLLPIGLIPTFSVPGSETEKSFPNSPRNIFRIILATSIPLTVCCTILLTGIMIGMNIGSIVAMIRNFLGSFGLLLIFGTIIPSTYTWIPIVTYIGLCWVFGTPDFSGTPYSWALPLHDFPNLISEIWFSLAYLLGIISFLRTTKTGYA